MKKNKRIWRYVFILVLLGIAVFGIVVYVQYRRGWFAEVIPYNGYAEVRGERTPGQVLGEELLTGEKRWHDGDWTPFDSTFLVAPEGVSIQNTIDATITQGTMKFVLFDLGEGLTTYEEGRQIVFGNLGICARVYEQDITETGVYQIDFSDLDPAHVYYASIMATMDGNNEYRYIWQRRHSGPRWYYIHDSKLARLPFIHEKYRIVPDWW